MKYTDLLFESEVRSLAPLLVCSALFTGFNTIVNWGEPYAAITVHAVLLGTLVYGGVLTLVYGAPLYAWLQYAGRASWLNVIVLGGLPGVIMLWTKLSLGIVVIACGVAVACATHYMTRNNMPRSRRDAAT